MEELQKQRQQAASSTSYYGYLPKFATTKSTTTKGASVEQDDSDDEDDEFITPASSPMAGTPPITSPGPNAGDTSATKSPETSQDQSGGNKSDLETALSRKLYEKFTISLSDMQVILGRNVFWF